MKELWGLDCTYADCRHDSVKGYRLSLAVHRSRTCLVCGQEREILPPQPQPEPFDKNPPDEKVVRCVPCGLVWRTDYERERNDMVFRRHELDFALSQMVQLGVPNPEVNAGFIAENHKSLPPGYDARFMFLREEALPKICMYFRWRPGSGEMLTPDRVFQCEFPPEAGAKERWSAKAVTLDEDQFHHIFRRADRGYIESMSMLSCQHCHRPLPLRAFSTLTLRPCAIGD